MAGKTTTWANDLLKLLFQAVPIANIADNATTAPLTLLYISLHTADPGAAGAQNTSEAAYTGYARVAVARPSPAIVSAPPPPSCFLPPPQALRPRPSGVSAPPPPAPVPCSTPAASPPASWCPMA